MKYLSNINEYNIDNIDNIDNISTPDLEHFDDQEIQDLESVESNTDIIERIKEISDNYTEILFNADLTDSILNESLYEYITLIQLLFLKNDLDFKKILQVEKYFDKKPFNIYENVNSLIWKCLTDFDFENEDKKYRNIEYLVDKLTEDVKNQKDLTRIKSLLKGKVKRKPLRKFLSENKKTKTDEIYDALTIVYFMKITDSKLITFLNNEDIEEYKFVDEVEPETDKKDPSIIDTISKKTSKHFNKAKDYAKKFIPSAIIGTTTAATTTALSSKHKKYTNILHPDVDQDFEHLISEIQKKGYKVVITSSYRDFKHQVRLKKQNKSNATPGHSPHNYGLAIDINIISPTGKWFKKATSKQQWMKTGIPQLAKSLGFRWGGDFKSYHDPVHFDVIDNKKYDTEKLLAKGKEQYGDIEDIIGNKVKIG